MFNNKLEKIIWEEISKIIEEKGILLEKTPTRLVQISKTGYQTFRNTLSRLSSVGRAALNKGEKDYLNTFLFPQHATQKGNYFKGPFQAKSARRKDLPPTSSRSRSARRFPRGGDDITDAGRGYSTESWGAEAFERAYVDSITKSARSLRAGLGSRAGLKNTSLKNKRVDGKGLSKSEINDSMDDAIQDALEHALKDLSTVQRTNRSLNRGIPGKELKKASQTFRSKLSEKVDVDGLMGQIGKKGGQARKDLEKIYRQPVDKLKVKAQLQKERVKRMEAGIKKQEDSLEALRKQKNLVGGETPKLDQQIRTAEKTLAKRKRELELGNNRVKKIEGNLTKKEKDLKDLNNLDDKAAGEKWLQKQIEKAADDADDAVMNGLDNFTSTGTTVARRSRTGPSPKKGLPSNTARPAGKAPRSGPKKPVSTKTAEQFMNNQSATFKELLAYKVDPSILGRSVDFVKNMTTQSILRLRAKILASENPKRMILGIIAGAVGTGVTAGGVLIALMGESEDVNGQKVPEATPEQLRDTAEKLDSLDDSLDAVGSKIDNAPNAAAQGEPAKIIENFNFHPDCQQIVDYIKKNTQAAKYFGQELPVDEWSIKKGNINIPPYLGGLIELELENRTEGQESSVISIELFRTSLEKYSDYLKSKPKSASL